MEVIQPAIRDVSMAWENRLRKLCDGSFQNHIRILHGPPSKDRIGGRMPLVSVYLLELHLSEKAKVGRGKASSAGDVRGVRLDYQISAWTDEPLDAQLLLDRIRADIDGDRKLHVEPTESEPFSLTVTPRPSMKLETGLSFWNTLGWPPQVALQYSVKP